MPTYPGPWQEGREHEVQLKPATASDAFNRVIPISDDPPDPGFECWFENRGLAVRNGTLISPNGGLYGSASASECVWEHAFQAASGSVFNIPAQTCATIGAPAALSGGAGFSATVRHEGDLFVSGLGIPSHSELWQLQVIIYQVVPVGATYTPYDLAPPPEEWPAGAVDVEAYPGEEQLQVVLELAVSPWTGGPGEFHCYAKAPYGSEAGWLIRDPNATFESMQDHTDLGGPGGGGGAFDTGQAQTLLDDYAAHATGDRPRLGISWADGWPGNWGDDVTEWVATPELHVVYRWRTGRYRFLFDVPPVLVAPPQRVFPRRDGLGPIPGPPAVLGQGKSYQQSNRVGVSGYW